MSTESKQPPGSGSMPEYRAHFELWNEAAYEYPDRVVSIPPQPAPILRWVKSPRYRLLAVSLMGVPVVVLVIFVWMAARVASPPMKLAAGPALKVAASPSAIPLAVIPANQAALAPPPPSAMASMAAPIEPAAAPSSTAPSKLAAPVEQRANSPQVVPSIEVQAESPSPGGEEEEQELAPGRRMLLESTIRSELAREGFSAIGVSVAGAGDVFLNGTLLNLADESRAIAMVRRHSEVRDIYFSGSVWHEGADQAEQATAAGATSSGPNVANPCPPPQPLAAKPPASSQQVPSTNSPESTN